MTATSESANSIELTYDAEIGVDTVDTDKTNPIFRALERSLQTGKPPGKLTHCYFQDQFGKWRWLGIFGLLAGNRVVLYLGFNQPPDRISQYRREARGVREQAEKPWESPFDHVTLEEDLKSTHLTASRSSHHSCRYSTIPLGERRFLWFGLSVKSADVMRPLSKRTVVSTTAVPAVDAIRRQNSIIKAFKGRVFQCVLLPPGAKIYWPGFAHFSVIAGPAGFSDYDGLALGFPDGSPFLRQPSEWPTKFAIRSHRISLDQIELQVVSTWLPGELTADYAFTGGALK